VRIIEPYAPLKKKGANWMACCPFHQEKTPSFSVNQAKGFYKCFGCGKGGNVFTFLLE
jgi:DNA primase